METNMPVSKYTRKSGTDRDLDDPTPFKIVNVKVAASVKTDATWVNVRFSRPRGFKRKINLAYCIEEQRFAKTKELGTVQKHFPDILTVARTAALKAAR